MNFKCGCLLAIIVCCNTVNCMQDKDNRSSEECYDKNFISQKFAQIIYNKVFNNQNDEQLIRNVDFTVDIWSRKFASNITQNDIDYFNTAILSGNKNSGKNLCQLLSAFIRKNDTTGRANYNICFSLEPILTYYRDRMTAKEAVQHYSQYDPRWQFLAYLLQYYLTSKDDLNTKENNIKSALKLEISYSNKIYNPDKESETSLNTHAFPKSNLLDNYNANNYGNNNQYSVMPETVMNSRNNKIQAKQENRSTIPGLQTNEHAIYQIRSTFKKLTTDDSVNVIYKSKDKNIDFNLYSLLKYRGKEVVSEKAIKRLQTFQSEYNEMRSSIPNNFWTSLNEFIIFVNQIHYMHNNKSNNVLEKNSVEDNISKSRVSVKNEKINNETTKASLNDEAIANTYKKLSESRDPAAILDLLSEVNRQYGYRLTAAQINNLFTLIWYHLDELNNGNKAIKEGIKKTLLIQNNKADYLFNATMYFLIKNYNTVHTIVNKAKSIKKNDLLSLKKFKEYQEEFNTIVDFVKTKNGNYRINEDEYTIFKDKVPYAIYPNAYFNEILRPKLNEILNIINDIFGTGKKVFLNKLKDTNKAEIEKIEKQYNYILNNIIKQSPIYNTYLQLLNTLKSNHNMEIPNISDDNITVEDYITALNILNSTALLEFYKEFIVNAEAL